MTPNNLHRRKKQKLNENRQSTTSSILNKSGNITSQDSEEVPTDTEDQASLPSISLSNNRPLITNESVRYSQNLTIDSQFGPDLNRIVIKPNDNINKRINQIFKYLTSHILVKDKENSPIEEVELLLISKNEGIQKLVTIIEIVKQKLNNLPKSNSSSKNFKKKTSNGQILVKNDRLAKFDNQKSIMIGTTRIENMPTYQYKQFNYLDYTTIQRSELRSKQEEKRKRKLTKATEKVDNDNDNDNAKFKDNFSKDHIAILQIDKTISLPVMYTYLNFNLYDDNAPVRLLKRFDDLIKDGWSLQDQ